MRSRRDDEARNTKPVTIPSMPPVTAANPVIVQSSKDDAPSRMDFVDGDR